MNEIIRREVTTGDAAVILAKVAKLQRRAAKLGLPAFHVSGGTDVTRTAYECVEWFGTERTTLSTPPAADGIWRLLKVITFTEIAIESVAVKLAGWTFVGTLSYFDTDNGREVLVSAVPGESVPAEFRTSTPDRCDHCNVARMRVESFIVRHEDGTHKQVGRQCLAAFLGSDPAKVVAWTRMLGEMGEDEFWGAGSRGEDAYPLLTFLGCVVHSIHEDGWLSRSKAREGFGLGSATADKAIDLHIGNSYTQTPPYNPTDAEIAEAQAALDWHADNWATLPEPNDYQHNLALALRLGCVVQKTLGIVASLIPVYQREHERQVKERLAAERAAQNPSQHVGTVGAKITITAACTGERWIEGPYGGTCIVTMVDDAGNVYKWFASNPPDWFLKAGEPAEVTGTIKGHDEWKGEKQTVLTRCKVQPLA